jgi:hypothetical protein
VYKHSTRMEFGRYGCATPEVLGLESTAIEYCDAAGNRL